MRAILYQPAALFATIKTFKFDYLRYIFIEKIEFRSIIDQIGTFTQNCSKVKAEYLKLLTKDEYRIKDIQSLAEMSSDFPC